LTANEQEANNAQNSATLLFLSSYPFTAFDYALELAISDGRVDLAWGPAASIKIQDENLALGHLFNGVTSTLSACP
jgi:hypothetical protein